jgi:tetratricopeptide (TPR) repeat protein
MPRDEAGSGPRTEPPGLGARIQELRVERGLTQRQLAEPEYTAAYVSTLEAGKARPSETALRCFADKLGISYRELSTGVPEEARVRLHTVLTEAKASFMRGGKSAEAVAALAAALAEAERYGIDDLRADLLVGRGEYALRRGAVTEASADFELAEQLLAEQPLPRRATAVRGRIRALHDAGELRYACYLAERTIDELNAQGLPDPLALVRLNCCLITIYLDMGATERAAKLADTTLPLAATIEDPVAVANLHCAVARTLATQARFEDAETYLVRAQAAFEAHADRDDLALCHWMRGYLHSQNSRLPEARTELEKAREMLRDSGAELYTVQVEVELADVQRRLGQGRDAVAMLTEVLARLGPGHGAVHAAAAHRLLGMIAEEEAAPDAPAVAEKHYATAIDLQEQAGVGGDLADTCLLLGDLLTRRQRTADAIATYRRGLTGVARPGTTTLGPSPR